MEGLTILKVDRNIENEDTVAEVQMVEEKLEEAQEGKLLIHKLFFLSLLTIAIYLLELLE